MLQSPRWFAGTYSGAAPTRSARRDAIQGSSKKRIENRLTGDNANRGMDRLDNATRCARGRQNSPGSRSDLLAVSAPGIRLEVRTIVKTLLIAGSLCLVASVFPPRCRAGAAPSSDFKTEAPAQPWWAAPDGAGD